jgi:AcrR family transcriptional regulator
MGRPPVALLSRERIADAALELLGEQEGHFTMTQLARRLGVKGPSLYNYVRGLGDVFELMRARVHEQLGPKLDPAWSWQDAVRHVARQDRESIGQHPWIVPGAMMNVVEADTPLESVRAFAAILEQAGFPPNDVLNIVTTVDLLAVGAALDLNGAEHIYGRDATLGDDALARALRASRTGRARADEAFAFALERLVEALERRLAEVTTA